MYSIWCMIEFDCATLGLRDAVGRSGILTSHSSNSLLNVARHGFSSGFSVFRRALGKLLYRSQHACRIDLSASQSGAAGPWETIISSLLFMLSEMP